MTDKQLPALSELYHTALRKGCDGEDANILWYAIKVWSAVSTTSWNYIWERADKNWIDNNYDNATRALLDAMRISVRDPDYENFKGHEDKDFDVFNIVKISIESLSLKTVDEVDITVEHYIKMYLRDKEDEP